jgi:hypothetical protein
MPGSLLLSVLCALSRPTLVLFFCWLLLTLSAFSVDAMRPEAFADARVRRNGAGAASKQVLFVSLLTLVINSHQRFLTTFLFRRFVTVAQREQLHSAVLQVLQVRARTFLPLLVL